MRKTSVCWMVFFCLAVLLPVGGLAATPKSSAATQKVPAAAASREAGDAMARHADQVKKEIGQQAASLFRYEKPGFSWHTFADLYAWVIAQPLRIPELWRHMVEQSRLLGTAGSALIAVFILALLYSLFGRRRMMDRIARRVAALQQSIPDTLYRYILPAVRVVAAALVPLILIMVYALIQALVVFEAAWFQLIGPLLRLWAVGALVIRLLRELLVNGLLRSGAEYGYSLFILARPVVLFVLAGVALVWAAQAFEMRTEILALFQCVISIAVILVLFLLSLKKKTLLSLLPQLPYSNYRTFRHLVEKYYFALIFFSLLLALLWSVGYRNLGAVVLSKLWFSLAAYIAVMLLYHLLQQALDRWYARTNAARETAGPLHQSLKRLLVLVATLVVFSLALNLFGLLGPLRQILSFPFHELGDTPLSLWILLQAAMIMVVFFFISRLVQAWLDYKVYPAVGIEPGLGYALNTFLNYLLFTLGVLVALNVVGLDLRFLLVFAGAAGIGIGLGLQSIVASIVSGFVLIFGGRLRKGDWIEVDGILGVVTDIHLRATHMLTRDHVSYIVPNSQLINGVLVNYSLGSPLIRISVPVSVAHHADPRQVERMLLQTAHNEPLVSRQEAPLVIFSAYSDHAIDFELLVWIDVRVATAALARSQLYFAVFEALQTAGIKIPFPRRDLHIRSVAPAPVVTSGDGSPSV